MTAQRTRDPRPTEDDPRHAASHAATHPAARNGERGGDRPTRPAHGGPVAVAWCALAVTCAVGLVTLVRMYAGPARAFPAAALAVAALLALPLAVGVTVLRRLRPRRVPPRRWCWVATGWGLTAAAGTAALANTGLVDLWSRTAGPEVAARWGAALTAPLNEELLKLSGVALLALAVPRLVRGPLDGFALGALVGLGFQTTETWSHALRAVVDSAGIAPAESALATATGRLLLVGAGSHVAISAVAGTAVGLLAARRARPPTARRGDRLAWAAAGLVVVALAMHAVLNAPLLADGAGPVGKALVNCAVAAALHQVLRRRLGTVLRGLLDDLGVRPRGDPVPSPEWHGRPAAVGSAGSRDGDGPGGTSSRRS